MFSKDSTDDCLVKITDTALFPILDRDLLKTSLDISAQYCGNQAANLGVSSWIAKIKFSQLNTPSYFFYVSQWFLSFSTRNSEKWNW